MHSLNHFPFNETFKLLYILLHTSLGKCLNTFGVYMPAIVIASSKDRYWYLQPNLPSKKDD